MLRVVVAVIGASPMIQWVVTEHIGKPGLRTTFRLGLRKAHLEMSSESATVRLVRKVTSMRMPVPGAERERAAALSDGDRQPKNSVFLVDRQSRAKRRPTLRVGRKATRNVDPKRSRDLG